MKMLFLHIYIFIESSLEPKAVALYARNDNNNNNLLRIRRRVHSTGKPQAVQPQRRRRRASLSLTQSELTTQSVTDKRSSVAFISIQLPATVPFEPLGGCRVGAEAQCSPYLQSSKRPGCVRWLRYLDERRRRRWLRSRLERRLALRSSAS